MLKEVKSKSTTQTGLCLVHARMFLAIFTVDT